MAARQRLIIFLQFHILCPLTAKPLARLPECPGSTEPSLFGSYHMDRLFMPNGFIYCGNMKKSMCHVQQGCLVYASIVTDICVFNANKTGP